MSNLTFTLPQIDFPAYFSSFAPRNYPENVIITYPPYVDRLSTILAQTPAHVIEGYLVGRTALSLAPNLGLDSDGWLAARKLQEVLNGLKKGAVTDRVEWCTGQVEQSLGFAAGRFFVETEFGGELNVYVLL